MAPGRVMAISPGASKRILELYEPATTRITRQKAKVNDEMNHHESLLHMDEDREMTDVNNEGGGSNLRTNHIPVEPAGDRDMTAANNEGHQLMLQTGKFIFVMLSFTNAFSKCEQCMYAYLFGFNFITTFADFPSYL